MSSSGNQQCFAPSALRSRSWSADASGRRASASPRRWPYPLGFSFFPASDPRGRRLPLFEPFGEPRELPLDGSEIVKTLEVSPTSSLHSAADTLGKRCSRAASAESCFCCLAFEAEGFELFFSEESPAFWISRPILDRPVVALGSESDLRRDRSNFLISASRSEVFFFVAMMAPSF